MFEIIGILVVELLAILLSEWIFGGLFNFIQGVGLRIYSLFDGTGKISIAELRVKHDDKILPWFLGFLVFGTTIYLLLTSLL
ncbi:hypothetical protein QWY85_14980 [Neolewinella lacunae]|uniref:Uncharacterized protein n=1 Tax=Neolewinella lacunae TaxID=1517758 RepID=A0A923TBL3_9BACT|nr:hypothetical protein [Neolewinella lacunae]MBC6992727.1 hypothetical protein [Neolewinella lacunae]MDN3635971.1 hypothetical protein [Neolewinella lacunae]